MHYFLIGMPGVGKSFWGKLISEKLGYTFIDLDSFIVNEEGKTISEIIQKEGEQYFRNKETTCLQKAISESITPTVLACGGGTPCYNNNMLLLKTHGTTIYLAASVNYLLQNLKNDLQTRPILASADNLPEVLQLLSLQRSDFYKQADIILQAENISLTTFEQIIPPCTNRQ